jgi:hypothetical protein
LVSTWSDLERSGIDRMSREQMLAAIRARADDLPGDLPERLEKQSTDWLQLLLLAGRPIQVLRHTRRGA